MLESLLLWILVAFSPVLAMIVRHGIETKRGTEQIKESFLLQVHWALVTVPACQQPCLMQNAQCFHVKCAVHSRMLSAAFSCSTFAEPGPNGCAVLARSFAVCGRFWMPCRRQVHLVLKGACPAWSELAACQDPDDGVTKEKMEKESHRSPLQSC